MVKIRIPEKHWGEVWDALVATGPIARVSEGPVYVISDSQLRMLRRKKLPFVLLPSPNGTAPDKKNG